MLWPADPEKFLVGRQFDAQCRRGDILEGVVHGFEGSFVAWPGGLIRELERPKQSKAGHLRFEFRDKVFDFCQRIISPRFGAWCGGGVPGVGGAKVLARRTQPPKRPACSWGGSPGVSSDRGDEVSGTGALSAAGRRCSACVSVRSGGGAAGVCTEGCGP